MAPRTVELRQAFEWTCDRCGRDNFVRAIRVEPESMEGREANEAATAALIECNDAATDLGLTFGGEWTMAPKEVKCEHCGTTFSTEEIR